VRYCADILNSLSDTDIASPDANGWVYVEYAYVSIDPPTFSVTSVQLGAPNAITDPFQCIGSYWRDGVKHPAYGTSISASSAPSAGWNDVHDWRVAPNLDDANLRDVAAEGNTSPDGYTDNTAAIQSVLADNPQNGDIFYFKPGLWIVNDKIIPPNVNCTFMGNGVVFSFIAPERQPGVNDPFGTNSVYTPLIETRDDSAVECSIVNMSPFLATEVPKAYAMNLRGKIDNHGIRIYRNSYWGFVGYTGKPSSVDKTQEEFLLSGNANGRWQAFTASDGYNAAAGFTQIRFLNMAQDISFYHANVEHVKEWPGNIRIEGGSGNITMYGLKCESNMPIVYATDHTGELRFHSVGGNFSGLIPDAVFDAMFTSEGNWADATAYTEHDWVTNDQGQNYPYYVCISNHTSSPATQPGVGGSWDTVWAWFPDKGLTKESLAPGGYPAAAFTPAMFVFEDCDNYEVSTAQDTPRITGYHPTFGNGTRPDKWHLITEIRSGVEEFVLPAGERPAMFKREVWTTYAHQYDIGDNTFFAAGYRTAQYGGLTPDTVDGNTVTDLFGNASNALFQCVFSGGQISGVDEIQIEFQGYPGGPITFPWVPGASAYRITDQALCDYIFGLSGSGIGVNISLVPTSNIQPGGIASAETFGTHAVIPGVVSVAVNGIPSAEAFGNPTILSTYEITVTGIPSAEAFGSHTVVPGIVTVTPTGVPSEEAFGAVTVVPGEAQILVNGISSEEAFGAAVLSSFINVSPLAISSEEAFGLPTIVPGEVSILPNSIVSEEAFGTHVVSAGGTIIVPPSILTGETFGITAIETGAVSVLPTGISSGEVFGVPTLVPGAATLLPASIVSAEAFGNALIESGASIVEAQAIASGEAFGTPVMALGGAVVAPIGIISQELFGTPLVAPGGVTLSPSGIATAEAFGVPSFLVGGVNVTPSGIVTQEAFGTPILTLGGVALSPLAIASQEIFGTPTLSTAIAVLPPSIGSQEAFGTPSLETGGTFVFPVAIPSEEIFGFIQVTGGAQPDQSFVRFVSMSQPMFRKVFNELLAKDPFAG